MRVYKFLPAKWAIKDVKQHKLKIAQFADLNDPFELLGFELSNPEYRPAFFALKQHADAKWGVLCFSRDWRSTLLWNHYADKHQGICLGFDVANELINEVKYATSRLPCELEEALAVTEAGEQFVQRLFTTKFQGWDYEEEVRVLIALKEEQRDGSHYLADFDGDIKLREIVLGPRCAAEDQAALRCALATYKDDISLLKARLAFRTFEVVRDLRGA